MRRRSRGKETKKGKRKEEDLFFFFFTIKKVDEKKKVNRKKSVTHSHSACNQANWLAPFFTDCSKYLPIYEFVCLFSIMQSAVVQVALYWAKADVAC